MTNQAVQVTKMLTGTMLSLACLGVVAFEKKLGIELDSMVHYALVLAALGPAALAGHGALKFNPEGKP